MIGLVDDGKMVDVVDFSKTFDTVSCNNIIDKLMKYRLCKWKGRWTENWLKYWAVISSMKSSWRESLGVYPKA